MNVFVCSDNHDNKSTAQWAGEYCKKNTISEAIILGDMIAPGMWKAIISCVKKAHCVWGNNDGEKIGIAQLLMQAQQEVPQTTFGEITIANKNIFITHYPLLGRIAAQSGRYDAVFYGHDHTQHQEKVGKTLLVNPGTLGGAGENASACVYDTEKNSVSFIIPND